VLRAMRVLAALCSCLLAGAALALPVRPRELPRGPLIAGYAPACDANTTRAVEQGVNVLYWFAASLLFNETTQQPFVSYGGPPLDCIAETAADLRARGFEVIHFLSVGGWNAPHVETATSPEVLHAAWRSWNRDVVSRAGFEGGFDGVDWDLEGNDNATAPENFFTAAVLDAVGVFSQLEKEAGYLVSMVPPESYLDPTTSLFDQSLTHAYPDGWEPSFRYHGHNAYAYLLSRYGEARAPGGGGVRAPTFDVVLIQLYESFSHLSYNLTQLHERAEDYLDRWVRAVVGGWTVDFASDANVSWPSADVRVPADRLLVGFGNGWAGATDKNALVLPADVGAAHERLRRDGLAPRGYFFWCIPSEGQVPAGRDEPLFFAAGLNDFLHVRAPAR
jgi:hypothetical protein